MSLPPRQDRAKALARSYGSDRDGWNRVEEYQRVLEYSGAHPDAGSTAVASALELPRSRARPWLDGAKPDPAHAVDTADQHGWLHAQPGDRIFEPVSLFTASISAGGSMTTDTYVPRLSAEPDDPQGSARSFSPRSATSRGSSTPTASSGRQATDPS